MYHPKKVILVELQKNMYVTRKGKYTCVIPEKSKLYM